MWFDAVLALSCATIAALLGWHCVEEQLGSPRGWWVYSGIVSAATLAVATLSHGIPKPALSWFTAAALVLAGVDALLLRLPNVLVYPTVLVVATWLPLAALTAARTEVALRVVIAGVAMGVLYLLLHVISPNGLGMGDVKFAPAIAMVMAWESWGWVLVSALSAFVLAAVWGTLVSVWRRGTREIPFGPFMVAGAAVTPVMGDPLLRWWM